MQKFLVTFDIHGGDQGSNIYAEIYKAWIFVVSPPRDRPMA